MRCTKHIWLLLALIGVLFAAPASRAQVTATATVQLTVVAGPGMNFIPSRTQTALPQAKIRNTGVPRRGMTFKSPGNVMVQLISADAVTSEFDLHEGEIKTFTARQLHDATSIVIDYLGS